MASKTVFFCSDCGNETAKWFGKCPACGEWNTLVETEKVTKEPGKKGANKSTTRSFDNASAPIKLSDISTTEAARFSVGMEEFDRVLGGGMVDGSLVLVSGDPGIGKSTLMLQICQKLAEYGSTLYVTGEESQHQLKMRAKRLGITAEQLYISAQVNMEAIADNINNVKPKTLIVDSVQTMYNPDMSAAPGSVSQVRDVTMQLMRKAKEDGISVFVVGHVTKDGNIAGPKVLEHMVDCVLYFEGERHQNYRILRSTKNRFGSTNEIGVFEMQGIGLVEVTNPSMALLEGRPLNVSGTSVICAMEGSRPILAEVQSLVASSAFGTPRRTSAGFDYNRIALLIAVLEKRVGMNLSTQDVYVNVIGGIRIEEPAADLGIALAIASAFRGFNVPDDMVAIGEVGLTGEIRAVNNIERRIAELEKLGFKECILPNSSMKSLGGFKRSITLHPVRNILEALAVVR